MKMNILNNLKPENVFMDPFPHLIIENALPENVYSQLESSFPGPYLPNHQIQVILDTCQMLKLIRNCLAQGRPTRGPRATCGPREGFEWPAR